MALMAAHYPWMDVGLTNPHDEFWGWKGTVTDSEVTRQELACRILYSEAGGDQGLLLMAAFQSGAVISNE